MDKKLSIKLFVFFCSCLSIILFATTVQSQEKAKYGEDDQCIVCHKDEEILPEDFSEFDIHLQTGLSCKGCHGGDETSDDEDLSMSSEAGFIGVPEKIEIAAMCGKCHSDINFMRQYQPRIATDQVQQYHESVHGKKLAQGDTKVADCTSCHSVHNILPAIDARSTIYALNIPATCKKCHSDKEYMAEYGIPTTQYDEYVESVHGVALLERQDTGAPACNDCHGNHGAMPPGIASIGHICGTCHVNNQEYFSKSKMAIEFQRDELHACEECHGDHDVKKTSDDMIGDSDSSTCVDCHEEGEEAYDTGIKIRQSLGGLVTAYDSAATLLKTVEHAGMDDLEMSYAVKDAKQSLTQARTLVHTFDFEQVKVKTDEGKTFVTQALKLGNTQMQDLRFRRLGFGIATFFMTIVLVALYFKIKDIERED
ncbi:MAG: hypothetical protein DWQ05_14720 [Calditrichaeota bacterium]|nr:MAG: hypothetical protein DWQ05_14720 [Calditrichota bacterium]